MKKYRVPGFACLFLLPLATAYAKVQVLHAFEFGPQNPQGRLLQATDGNFYGTAVDGGDSATVGGLGNGCIFRATPAGIITNVFSFVATNGIYTRGENPYGALVQGLDGKLYGTTQLGGAYGAGTVFSYVIGGTLATLYSFDNTNGANPHTGLTFGPDGALYGTAYNGGANLSGTVFRITTSGLFTNLYSFGATNPHPATALCLGADNNFYGGTMYGPANGASYYTYGTLFNISTNGSFTQLVGLTNTIGFNPGNTFTRGPDSAIYGTLQSGGPDNAGCAFRLATDGTFTVLANFFYVSSGGGAAGGLTYYSGTNFYGVTTGGSTNSYGALFRLALNTANYSNSFVQTLDSFNALSTGATPVGGLTLANDGKFYAMAASGGSVNGGLLFKTDTNGPLTALSSLPLSAGSGSASPLIIGPDGSFYGTTYYGGATDSGTVFRITTNGAFMLLASLGGSTGKNTYSPLCVGADGALYGATYGGGSDNAGAIFRITTGGVLQPIVQMVSSQTGGSVYGGMALGPDGALYGTAQYGGAGGGMGTIFRLTNIGTNYTLTPLVVFVGTNGANPQGTLFNNGDGFLYGTTFAGGTNGDGTIFRINTNGAFNTVATFNMTNGYQPIGGLVRGADGALYGGGFGNFSNSRRIYRVTTNGLLTSLFAFPGNYGSEQYGSLTAGPDGYLYDALYDGGPTGAGLLFRVNTNGVAAILSILTTGTGIHPFSTPIFGPDGNLYGTTYNYGPGGGGTVYRFVFDHLTSIARSGSNALITATGTSGGNYAISATTNLATAAWTNLATVIATNSFVQFTDTNAGKFPQRFYRTAAQ